MFLLWKMFFILVNEITPLRPAQRNTTSGKVRSRTNLEISSNLLLTYHSESPKTSLNAAVSALSYPTPPSCSAEKIASSEDILCEIFLLLPIKSLSRFKSVSKHWLSLISNPEFCRRQKDFLNPVSGLFLKRNYRLSDPSVSVGEFKYVNLDETCDSSEPPLGNPVDLSDSGIRILQSCNGLLLCSRANGREKLVCNPTTTGYTLLPPLFEDRGCTIRTTLGLSLAFHPWISPHYKVICVRCSELKKGHFQIMIYSSETLQWRDSGDPFNIDGVYYNFRQGVFLINGCVHWLSYSSKSLCFNVREERLMPMPMPQIDEYKYRYYGESRGHLHLIASAFNPQSPILDVFEMKMDCSCWFVKFRVNLLPIIASFPELFLKVPFRSEECYFSTLCVVRGLLDEESYLVLEIPGAVIRYNFNTETFEKICDIDGSRWRLTSSFDAHQYVKTLTFV
ncbi:hypothetical protein TIFTF001_010270 [Ficus carica]|uniref:F-box domain-containing protein n=1 Tax=Ficus carica TaxID=3494 RepID=A0AA88A8E5_FICCA|nr:hypothetical protein TIFTF001_010270 [Ficus carica]